MQDALKEHPLLIVPDGVFSNLSSPDPYFQSVAKGWVDGTREICSRILHLAADRLTLTCPRDIKLGQIASLDRPTVLFGVSHSVMTESTPGEADRAMNIVPKTMISLTKVDPKPRYQPTALRQHYFPASIDLLMRKERPFFVASVMDMTSLFDVLFVGQSMPQRKTSDDVLLVKPVAVARLRLNARNDLN